MKTIMYEVGYASVEMPRAKLKTMLKGKKLSEYNEVLKDIVVSDLGIDWRGLSGEEHEAYNSINWSSDIFSFRSNGGFMIDRIDATVMAVEEWRDDEFFTDLEYKVEDFKDEAIRQLAEELFGEVMICAEQLK